MTHSERKAYIAAFDARSTTAAKRVERRREPLNWRGISALVVAGTVLLVGLVVAL